MTARGTSRAVWVVAAFLAVLPRDAAAQLDPLLFLKDRKPNVVLVVDTANRMQRDHHDDYRDNAVYTRGLLSAANEAALGVSDANTAVQYRRKYIALGHTDPAANAGDRFEADHIEVVGDLSPGFASFDSYTRMSIARRALAEAVSRNSGVARFGLMRMRQSNPHFTTVNNEGPVKITSAELQWADQRLAGDLAPGKWAITRPVVDAANGAVAGPVGPLVPADAQGANGAVLAILNAATGAAGSLVPAGRDAKNTVDAPVDLMLDDARTEATRLVNGATNCCNTVVVMVVGGGRGTTSSGDLATKASQFTNVGSNHRVPVYVIAIAPAWTAAEKDAVASMASESGGEFLEVTAATVENTPAGQPVPEIVAMVNRAVGHAFSKQSDFDVDPGGSLPYGGSTEHQVTSPIIGTVNLEGGRDITGVELPNSVIYKDTVKIPQRSNVMVTSGFSSRDFTGRLRAFRVYAPELDATKPSGYKFTRAGTKLWVAKTPAAASRNIYTALPDGTMVAFDAANAAALEPYLNTADVADATRLIDFIRSQPLGAVVSSTPAIMDPPSLDPPPDPEYPAFAAEHKNRRSIVWVGANDGMLHAIDGRLGIEVWAFIPFNLLPKLHALRSGQAVGDFRFFVDASPKVSEVKVDGSWRTYLIMGEGPGGTFYQTFDVTLPGIATTAPATDDNIANVLAYFANTSSVPLKWAFPRYSSFDVSIGPYGDIAATASAVEKTVGETWSDPAVGQIVNATGPFAVLTGSGFLRRSIQEQANRGGTVAGTHFYVLDVETGAVFASRSVGSDGLAEHVDDCAAVNNCMQVKNALQADPVATGPPDSRHITKAYIGDLDGRIWRFDLALDTLGAPEIPAAPTLLHDAGAAHPMFTSMATINVGNALQYLFQGTGSDLLPSNGVNVAYKLLVVLDNGGSGSNTATIPLEKTDNLAGDEKVAAFPAVAGDIVFFATNTSKPTEPCLGADGNLYAFTFIGGPAYDTNNDGKLSNSDGPRVRTATGARASAPFIVDQHVVFAVGDKIETFGDPEDYNNGVGQVGVRILSWREVR
jgi:hypothetical protein